VAKFRAQVFALAIILGAVFAPTTLYGQGTEIFARASKLKIGGRIHPQFAHSSVEEGKAADFFVRRARLVLEIEINELVSGKLEHDFAIGLRDAYVRFNFDPALRVSVGQMKRSFDIFELYSTTQISVVERTGRIPGLGTCEGPGGICSYSTFTERLQYAGRDVGVRVDGTIGGASYQASITNGAAVALKVDQNDTKSFAGRLVVPLAGDLRMGGNFSVHDYQTEDEENEFGSAYGADLEYGSYLQPGPHLQLSVVAGDNWRAGQDVSFLTGQAVYMHYIPVDSKSGNVVGFEPVARISWGDPNGDIDSDGGTLLTPGFMVYFKERTRIGASFDVWKPQSGDTDYSLKVQSYIWF
jgi:hypothetical protein